MKKWWILKGIKVAIVATLGIFAFGYIVMMLWNWLVPELFHGPVITYIQAFGLLVLFKIFFGGFRGKWGGGCCGHGHGWKGRGHWRERCEEKLANMSPEEREKIKEKWGAWGRDCCKTSGEEDAAKCC